MEHLEINVREVLRRRMPKYFPFIPRPLISGLESFICQKEMNRLLDATEGLHGAEFCDEVLRHLNITYSVDGTENIPTTLPETRVLFVSNHPLGGLDGITLISVLSRLTGQKVKFLVNDLLMAVSPLHDTFLPINKHGAQSRHSVEGINNAFNSTQPIVIFPAGLCSRMQKNNVVADLQWQKSFVTRAIQSQRDIIPLHFDARNSNFFYNFAKIRKAVKFPFNLEMLRLPAEVVKSRDKHFKITVGERIPWQTLKGGADAAEQALLIRNLVYNLPAKKSSTSD